MRIARPFTGVVLAIAVGAGCSRGPAEPIWEESLAPIDLQSETHAELRLEDGSWESVETPYVGLEASGRLVTVTILTFGTGGCAEESRVGVEQSGMEAYVTPYLLQAPPGSDCNRVWITFQQTAVITFPEEGTASVTVQGFDDLGASPDVIEVQRTIEL